MIIDYLPSKLRNELIKRYKLEKDKRVFDINEIEYKPKLELDSDDKNVQIHEGSLSDVIHEFVYTLESNFSEDELITFYNNIKTLDIEYTNNDDYVQKKKKYTNYAKTLAYYKIANNVIYILDTSKPGILYHELFHVSTSKREGNTSFNGFCQTNLTNGYSIGDGLNEGYTQIMAERYFKNASSGNYNIIVYIVDLLELIVGKDRMEHYYMTSDLYSLVDYLKQYSDYNDICKFISYLDFIVKHIYDKNLNKKDLEYFKEILIFLNEFILETYANKIRMSNLDEEEEYNKCYLEFSYLVNRSFIYANIDDKKVDCFFGDDEVFVKKLTNTLDGTGIYFELE